MMNIDIEHVLVGELVLGATVILCFMVSCNMQGNRIKGEICKEALKQLSTIQEPAQSNLLEGCRSFQ